MNFLQNIDFLIAGLFFGINGIWLLYVEFKVDRFIKKSGLKEILN